MANRTMGISDALPEDGRIVCCDVSEEWTSVAARYWDEAGVAAKVLWSGDVLKRDAPDADTRALQALNAKLAGVDPSVSRMAAWPRYSPCTPPRSTPPSWSRQESSSTRCSTT